MAKILVTGSSGFIGSHLVKRLRDDGHDVTGIDIVPSEYTTYNFDIRNPRTNPWCNVCGFDVIFHLAALTDVRESIKNPYDYFDTNVKGTMNLIDRFDGKFIFASSVYSNTKENPYLLFKDMAEELVRKFCKDWVILKFPNIYGLRSKSVISKFMKSDDCKVYGDGTQYRDYVYIDDLIDILVKSMDYCGTYNLGTNIKVTVNDILNILHKRWKNLPEILGEVKYPHFPGLNFTCKTTVKEGIERMLK